MSSVSQRFLRYAVVSTASDPDSPTSPSSSRQFDLLRILEEELLTLGMENVFLSETGVLYAKVPGGRSGETIGLIAHVDTSPDAPGEGVNPRLHSNWEGEVIELSEGVTIDPAECADMLRYKGGTVITSDGTTLLGSDDKSGVAIIMETCKWLIENPEIAHPVVVVAFTPDEEVGRGMDNFDVDRFGADFAYTVDGGEVTEVSSETFNAWSANWKITGKEVHPGSASGTMVNAVRIAGELIALMRSEEMPENSSGLEGYDYPLYINGTTASAEVKVILRDFTTEGMIKRRRRMETIRDCLASLYPGSQVELNMKEQYSNPGEILKKDRRLVDYALEGFRQCGIEVREGSIRGGTDGSRLSFMGVPTANLPTGGELFHSRREWVAEEGLDIALQGLKNTLRIWGESH
ncbi:MAG: peptidase T [Gemmatimonadaceae bacterium 4484_173]|nr:MAG: peptidase T [Gemmatimonadaceae bacterium 4484_173]RKZ03365.1 MAG: peptidase T [Candidatus Fermentibacteria bacterium]